MIVRKSSSRREKKIVRPVSLSHPPSQRGISFVFLTNQNGVVASARGLRKQDIALLTIHSSACVEPASLVREKTKYSTCRPKSIRRLNGSCCLQLSHVQHCVREHCVMALEVGSCRERQEEELQVLQSIYADDVEDLRTKAAWNVSFS